MTGAGTRRPQSFGVLDTGVSSGPCAGYFVLAIAAALMLSVSATAATTPNVKVTLVVTTSAPCDTGHALRPTNRLLRGRLLACRARCRCGCA